MLDTTLTPIVNTKTGDVTDKNNYRPIAVATSMSGTCKFFQVTGQIATLQWSRGPDNVEHVNEG